MPFVCSASITSKTKSPPYTKLYEGDKVEIIVATPVPKEDYMSKQSAQALEFYENGNIKTLKLADVKYSYNKNGYLSYIEYLCK